VVARAAELIADDGLESFSLRGLAETLGVAPNGLYNHVRDRDELLDAVVDVFAAQLTLPPVAAPWLDWVRSVAVALRRQMLEHPGRAELLLSRAGTTAAGPVAIEAFLDASAGARIDRADAHLAWHAVLTVVAGSDRQDRARAAARDDTFDAVLDVTLAGLAAAVEHGPSAESVRLLTAHDLGRM
jgi:AcrR family transcriptional regulator